MCQRYIEAKRYGLIRVSMCVSFVLLVLVLERERFDQKYIGIGRHEYIWVLVYTCIALKKLLFEANNINNNTLPLNAHN